MNRKSTPNDETLTAWIEAARTGDQSACAAIYQRHVHSVYRLARGVLLNEQDAEEVVQDSFSYVFRSLHRYDPARSAFRTWLYTITMSRCRNKRRRKWWATIDISEIAEWWAAADPTPEHAADERTAHDALMEALSHLSPKLREAVTLRYFEGLTYREMADVLQCPAGTAESRVRLAHEALYRMLAERPEVLPERLLKHDPAR